MSTHSFPFIRVLTQFEALHCWPDAPVPEEYLSYLHRHLFIVDVRLQVNHDDRELEINQVKRFIDKWVRENLAPPADESVTIPSIGSSSCEMIAVQITEALIQRYGGQRYIEMTVLEDGQLGGGYCYYPKQRAMEEYKLIAGADARKGELLMFDKATGYVVPASVTSAKPLQLKDLDHGDTFDWVDYPTGDLKTVTEIGGSSQFDKYYRFKFQDGTYGGTVQSELERPVRKVDRSG